MRRRADRAPIVISPALSLEPLCTDHLAALFEISKDKDSIEDFQKASSDYAYFMEWIKGALSDDECAWTIMVKGAPCGLVTFEHIRETESEIGFFLDRRQQRTGIMTAAIRASLMTVKREFPHLKKVVASATASNIASNRVLRKCGFRLVRTVQKNWNWRGVMHDTNKYAWTP